MNVRLPTTRTVSRDGVNAAQTFFEHNGCVFQEVAQQNDFGKDAYVDLSHQSLSFRTCRGPKVPSERGNQCSGESAAFGQYTHGGIRKYGQSRVTVGPTATQRATRSH